MLHNYCNWLNTWIFFEYLVHSCSNFLLKLQCSRVFEEAIPLFHHLKVREVWWLLLNLWWRLWCWRHKLPCMYRMDWLGIDFRMEYRSSRLNPWLIPSIHHCIWNFVFSIQVKIVPLNRLDCLIFFFGPVSSKKRQQLNKPMQRHKGLVLWLMRQLHNSSSQKSWDRLWPRQSLRIEDFLVESLPLLVPLSSPSLLK